MEVCSPRPFSKLPHFRSCSTTSHFFLSTTPFSISLSRQGFQSFKGNLKSANSEETSTGTSLFVKNEPGVGIHPEDEQPSQEENYGESMPNQMPEDKPVSVVTMEDKPTVDETESEETGKDQASEEDSPLVLQKQLADFVEELNQKFESDDSYSLVLFGGTAATALYLASAIVGAIDSIPILPKLLEAVGLGYTVWFTSRYLLFKKNRDELAVKIEELKQQVIGSKDE